MTSAHSNSATSLYVQLLAQGETGRWLALFTEDPIIADPREGYIEGRESALRFANATFTWLNRQGVAVEPVAVTRSGAREVTEVVLHLTMPDGRRIGLPVAVVGDLASDGRLREVRVYHSMWPLTGGHMVRPPLLFAGAHLEIPGVVGRYMQALGAGDLEGILSLFDPSGYAREPSGGEYAYRGPARLREFYSSLFKVGGIPLEHCTATDDGTRTVLEYNVVEWGGKPVTPQAGVAVYERGANGLLIAARIYDDVAIEEGV